MFTVVQLCIACSRDGWVHDLSNDVCTLGRWRRQQEVWRRNAALNKLSSMYISICFRFKMVSLCVYPGCKLLCKQWVVLPTSPPFPCIRLKKKRSRNVFLQNLNLSSAVRRKKYTPWGEQIIRKFSFLSELLHIPTDILYKCGETIQNKTKIITIIFNTIFLF